MHRNRYIDFYILLGNSESDPRIAAFRSTDLYKEYRSCLFLGWICTLLLQYWWKIKIEKILRYSSYANSFYALENLSYFYYLPQHFLCSNSKYLFSQLFFRKIIRFLKLGANPWGRLARASRRQVGPGLRQVDPLYYWGAIWFTVKLPPIFKYSMGLPNIGLKSGEYIPKSTSRRLSLEQRLISEEKWLLK